MRLKEVVSRNNYITGCYFFKIKSSNLRKLLLYMKEVFKMSPLFTGNQNLNIRRMSDDSAISLLASSGDFSSISNSSTISIFEETAIRENKYLLNCKGKCN